MKTKVSSKGQVLIPKSVRNRFRWKAGTVLQIEETAHGVILSPTRKPSVSRDEVLGCLKSKVAKKVTLKEMDSIIEELASSNILYVFKLVLSLLRRIASSKVG